jgi:hypothetical protein
MSTPAPPVFGMVRKLNKNHIGHAAQPERCRLPVRPRLSLVVTVSGAV